MHSPGAKSWLFLACAVSVAAPLAARDVEQARAEEPQAQPQEAEAQPAQAAAKASPDGRRTGRRFVPNYGRDLVGVFSKESLKPLLITAGAAGVGSLFDDNLVRYFSQERRAKWLGDAGDWLGRPIVIVPLATALYGLGRLNHHQSFRDASYDVAEVTLVAATYETALKYTVRRERPDGSNNLSFPSGHTSNAFAWATVGAHYYGWKVGVPGYIVASLIGVSRMELNVHHLSDVLAGAGLGYISAKAVMRKNSEPLPEGPARTARLTFAPIRDPHGQGAGLVASLAF